MFTKQDLKDFKKLFTDVINKQIEAQKEFHKPEPLTRKEYLTGLLREYKKTQWQNEIVVKSLERLAPLNNSLQPKLDSGKQAIKELNQTIIILEEELK